jgi:hypothetical protein
MTHNWNFKNLDDPAVAFCTTSKTCQWKLLFERLFRLKHISPKCQAVLLIQLCSGLISKIFYMLLIGLL